MAGDFDEFRDENNRIFLNEIKYVSSMGWMCVKWTMRFWKCKMPCWNEETNMGNATGPLTINYKSWSTHGFCDLKKRYECVWYIW